jgi:hypothetical protein
MNRPHEPPDLPLRGGQIRAIAEADFERDWLRHGRRSRGRFPGASLSASNMSADSDNGSPRSSSRHFHRERSNQPCAFFSVASSQTFAQIGSTT